MNGSANLLTAAALVERAYRLALVLQDESISDRVAQQFLAAELADVLDETRVALLAVSSSSTQDPGPGNLGTEKSEQTGADDGARR